MRRILKTFGDEWIGGLSYRTPRYVRVHIWQVAVGYYALCALALFYVAWSIVRLGSYSYSSNYSYSRRSRTWVYGSIHNNWQY